MSVFDPISEIGNYYIIKNFPITNFLKKLKKEYKTTKLNNLLQAVGVKIFNNRSIKIHKFFIPELLFLLNKFNYPAKLINNIIEYTWISSDITVRNRISLDLIHANMSVKLKDYQKQFIESYDTLKQKNCLNGMLLSFEQGLGKTITALATMVAINKSKVIIIAPKSVLETVWVHHINLFFKKTKKIYVVNTNQKLDLSYDFYIFNYENIDVISDIADSIVAKGIDVGLIVDESHNFLRIKSNRSGNLINLREALNCKDVLLLSGTPLKAVGSEIIPMLYILDPFFDESALSIFKLTFGLNTNIANDILNARLNSMMYRKLKAEVLVLPEKHEHIIQVHMPSGINYTIDRIKAGANLFATERFEYHSSKMDEYIMLFDEVIRFIRIQPSIKKNSDFIRYLGEVNYLRKYPANMQIKEVAERVMWVNKFEKDIIYPLLPPDLKKKYKQCISAIKYVHLKVRGEVLGQYLSRMRIKMTTELVEHARLENIINSAVKKTIVFTSYVDTVVEVGKYLDKQKYNTLVLHGTGEETAKSAVKKFIEDLTINPLVSSINMLVTGVTLVEANTMIFLNKPFRYTDYTQASDRIHRIGQDTEVHIYTILLDTGTIPNLSTRMEEVMEWSKDQFSALVDGDDN